MTIYIMIFFSLLGLILFFSTDEIAYAIMSTIWGVGGIIIDELKK